MEVVRRKQEESIESREELLRELEEVQRMTARERLEQDKRRRELDEEMRAQVSQKVLHCKLGIKILHPLMYVRGRSRVGVHWVRTPLDRLGASILKIPN